MKKVIVFALCSIISTFVTAKPSKTPVECANTDISSIMVVDSISNGSVIACYGAENGNDPADINAQSIWSVDGVLTDVNATTTNGWLEVGKINMGGAYEAGDSGIVGGGTNGDPFTFTDCLNNEGQSTSCDGGWQQANFDFSVVSPEDSTVVYSELVLAVKSASFYALYQIGISPGVQIPFSLTGMIKTFNGQEISHLTAWLKEGESTPHVSASAPHTLALIIAGVAVLGLRRKWRMNSK